MFIYIKINIKALIGNYKLIFIYYLYKRGNNIYFGNSQFRTFSLNDYLYMLEIKTLTFNQINTYHNLYNYVVNGK